MSQTSQTKITSCNKDVLENIGKYMPDLASFLSFNMSFKNANKATESTARELEEIKDRQDYLCFQVHSKNIFLALYYDHNDSDRKELGIMINIDITDIESIFIPLQIRDYDPGFKVIDRHEVEIIKSIDVIFYIFILKFLQAIIPLRTLRVLKKITTDEDVIVSNIIEIRNATLEVVNKALTDFNKVNTKPLKGQPGGSKAKSKNNKGYSITNSKHEDKKTKKMYVIYKKDGSPKQYIKKLSKTTGKFSYKAI